MLTGYLDPTRLQRTTLRIRVQAREITTMPDQKDDNQAPLDRVRGNRGLARGSGFIAKRARDLALPAPIAQVRAFPCP